MGIFVSSAQVNVGYFYANDQAAPTYLTPSVISMTVKVHAYFSTQHIYSLSLTCLMTRNSMCYQEIQLNEA